MNTYLWIAMTIVTSLILFCCAWKISFSAEDNLPDGNQASAHQYWFKVGIAKKMVLFGVASLAVGLVLSLVMGLLYA